jgi:xylulokinase
MAKLLGIDVGTSGAKALLMNERGEVLAQASAEYPLSTPRSLWSEQDPTDWWRGVCQCIEKIGERKPDAIGLTGQMHGAVFLDDDGSVIRPAILWNDQRTTEEIAEIDQAVGKQRVREITRNPPLTGFQAPKLLWLRNNELSNYQKVHQVLLPKDYIRFKLTGRAATDMSDASGTGLFDVPRREWSLEMLVMLELSPDLLPHAHESWEETARTIDGPLEQGIPVVAGGGDQAAGAVGTGAVAPGILSVSLGTSGVVFSALDEPSYDPEGRVHTFCHANGAWHVMGVMLSCGGALRWLRNTIFPSESYDAIAAAAAEAPAGAEGLTFLPYLSGERTPHNDPHARGSFSGLTLSHGRSHLARAVFEGISFGLLDSFELLCEMGVEVNEIRVTGGGARSGFWLGMLGDLFGMPCATLEADEGPAYGAAILAGVGIRQWPDVVTACRSVVRVKQRIEPAGIDYEAAHERYRTLYGSLREWMRKSPQPPEE